MQTNKAEAQKALTFAQSHDWGRQAHMVALPDNQYVIDGLIDAYTYRGAYQEEITNRPATMAALAKFARY